MTINKQTARVGFYLLRPFHHAMLDSIYAQLKDELNCLITDDYAKLVVYQPHILVSADMFHSKLRGLLPNTITIMVGHGGIAGKNYSKELIAWSDFYCFASECVKNFCFERQWFPRLGYWVVGITSTDRLFQQTTLQLIDCFKSESILNSSKTLLYAPTFTPKINAIDVVKIEGIQQIRRQFPELNIIIKLHPLTAKLSSDWIKSYQALAQQDEKIYFANMDDNISDYMHLADILLSDVSSVMFHFLHFNRPLILVNNPQRFENKQRFAADSFAWQWRDMGIEVETIPQLVTAIQRTLENPQEKEQQRLHYKQLLFGNMLDGQASTRIANKIKALITPQFEDEAWVTVAWNSLRMFSRYEQQIYQLEHSAFALKNPYHTFKIITRD